MKLGILMERSKVNNHYIQACKDLDISFTVIDISSSSWLEEIKSSGCKGFLIDAKIFTQVDELLYKERLFIINKILNVPIYPSYEEIFLYENKRNMAYWLSANNIPKPKTWIFYKKNEALDFLKTNDNYPMVFKPNIGSGSLGIKFINNDIEARKLVNRIFTKWKFFNRGFMKWYKTKYNVSYPIMDDKQYNNIMFQEKINVKYEWRGVKIGDSYFAHKKLPGENGLHSGSGKAEYGNPPEEVMEFLKKVCDKGKFRSMNVDFFEDKEGKYYVNELQTIFGSNIKPYQMLVNNKPGRYLYINNKWKFEEGSFNQNNSDNLRVLDFLNVLRH